MQQQRKVSGYTLIEITIVLIIVAILASVATGGYFRIVEKSQQVEAIEVLTRFRRGYRILVVDEMLNPATYRFNNPNKRLTNGTLWDPDIAGADWEWGLLGFEDNPNNNADLDFSYEFWPRDLTTTLPCSGPDQFPEITATHPNIAAAIRRVGGSVDCSRYIFIYCDNGTIVKSPAY